MSPLVWLVTGTSSGFGRAFVESILAKGDNVIATARGDPSRLIGLRDLGAATLSLDVTAPQTELDQIVEQAVKIYGRIDVLVNNAGYIEAGVLEEIDEELLTRAWKANILGPLNLTRAVLSHMRPRQSGTLIFMGSIGAYRDNPGSLAYNGSKAAIESIAATIGLEVGAFNIRCTTLIPDYYRTSVFSPGNMKFDVPKRLSDYAELNRLMRSSVGDVDRKQPGDTRKAADIVVDVVHGDGVAEGLPWPTRLPLGVDTIKAMRQDCESALQVCEVWEKIVSATDYDGELRKEKVL